MKNNTKVCIFMNIYLERKLEKSKTDSMDKPIITMKQIQHIKSSIYRRKINQLKNPLSNITEKIIMD
ncbi:hypothetical protein OIU74_012178 [Salix koriyanagi]|uniref:Uncharacterized protein n=1 Tax=Salix koriyanagi TaxID=2511006 RepID=A0A9Q0Q6K4_9ROSI|nr:hypothetical protein OIU74_012178 [Salix koriyanagi]